MPGNLLCFPPKPHTPLLLLSAWPYVLMTLLTFCVLQPVCVYFELGKPDPNTRLPSEVFPVLLARIFLLRLSFHGETDWRKSV